MVPGDPGKAGPSVPRPAEEDQKITPDVVTLQFRPMVEIAARANLHSQHPATNISVSFIFRCECIFRFRLVSQSVSQSVSHQNWNPLIG